MSTNVFTPPSQISYIEGSTTLGIQIRNTTELIQELEQGLDAAVATRLAKHLRLPLEGFFTQAGIPSRSIKTALKAKSRLSTDKSETMYRLGRIFERTLKVFHGNDSKKPCGSRVDRHEHIGEGCLGLEPFRRLLHDRRFSHVPILIETEKAMASAGRTIVADPYDVKNLETLRMLRGGGS